MITVIPLREDHVSKMGVPEFSNWTPDQFIDTLIRCGIGLAMVEGDKFMGCGGVIQKWPGVGELWLNVTEEMRKRPLILVRIVKDMVARMQMHGHYHRLQMQVAVDDERNIEFAKFLGFELEGIMRRNGPDRKDHALFAKIYD